MPKMTTLTTSLTQPQVTKMRCGSLHITPDGNLREVGFQAFNLDVDNKSVRFPDLDVDPSSVVDYSTICAAEVAALQAAVLAAAQAAGVVGAGTVADQPARRRVPAPAP